MPHSRLLLFAGIGAFGLLALWMDGVIGVAAWIPAGRTWRRTARVMLVAFLCVHLLVAPLLLPMNATSAAFGQPYIQDAVEAVPAGPELAGQDLVILNHPIVYYGHFFPTVRILAGQSSPRRVRVLAPAVDTLHVRRPDIHTLVVRPKGGFLGLPFDNVFRGPGDPMAVGDRVVLTGMTVEIMQLTADGRPAEASFRFASPLEDSTLRWLRWAGQGYVRFVPPAVDDTCTVPPAPPLF
jgi:hypothetical protein